MNYKQFRTIEGVKDENPICRSMPVISTADG